MERQYDDILNVKYIFLLSPEVKKYEKLVLNIFNVE